MIEPKAMDQKYPVPKNKPTRVGRWKEYANRKMFFELKYKSVEPSEYDAWCQYQIKELKL